MNAHAADPKRWKALAVLGVAYLMVVLDVAIVNVALPSIQSDLDFSSTENLQWVVSGYALTFGGLLLLGGRAGDILGRRRIFMVGLALFALFSLLCGLATSSSMLIAMRALQGAAGAVLSPSVFSITSVTFEEGAERNKALGILGAIAGSGAAIGVLLGGVLTEYAGWEWIFFVNVPIGVAALALVPLYVRESRAADLARYFDAWGAVSVTTGLMLFVYALTRAPSVGWTSAEVIGAFVGWAILTAVFIVIELRSHSPLVPLAIFKRRTLTGSNVIGFLLGVTIFGMFFLLSLYMQNVLGFSAVKTGWLLLRAGLHCSACRRDRQGSGPPVGSDQHEPADRRRARARDPDHGRDHTREPLARRRRRQGVGADAELQPRLLGRRGLRARRAGGNARAAQAG